MRRPFAGTRRARPAAGSFDVPAYLRSAYLWIFIFRRDRWPYHQYEIAGEETLFGRSAVVIRFEPVPSHRETINSWYGSAWVDLETAQLLKVVAHRPEEHDEMRRIERHRAGEAVSDWVYFVEEISSEFKTEERGMTRSKRDRLQPSGVGRHLS